MEDYCIVCSTRQAEVWLKGFGFCADCWRDYVEGSPETVEVSYAAESEVI